MSHADGHSAELEARELGACLREAARRDSSVEHLAAEAERLRRAVVQTGNSGRPATARRGRAIWLLAAAALVMVVGFGVWSRALSHTQPIAFEVIGPGRVSSSYVAAPENAPTTLKFTDGSSVVAHQGTRLRVPELRSDGVTLLLERGKATIEVVHRTRATRWNVVAGPYAIVVTGTRFTIEWTPSSDRFAVEMLEGYIEVDGPKFTAPATLRGGQRMTANAKESVWVVTPLHEGQFAPTQAERAQPPSASPSGDAADSKREPTTARRSRSSNATQRLGRANSGGDTQLNAVPSASPNEGKVSWAKMVAQGEAQKVLAEAEVVGTKACLDQCSSSDLRALADAARYSGRLDLAEASLRALRERFPSQAAVASYLLGTVDEARGRNASALRWYEEYVAAHPGGAFSSEALAGRLRMLLATNGYTSARKAAQQYLEQYPNGIGARTAKQILERK